MTEQRLTRHEDILMMSYFHHEKGDVTRWSSWEKRRETIRHDFPELLTAIPR